MNRKPTRLTNVSPYNEPYLAVPMWHDIGLAAAAGGHASYGWRHQGKPFELRARVAGPAVTLEPGSEAEFITEHYWGYTRQRDGGTLEYQVEHPRWPVWTAAEARFSGPATQLYGPAFGDVLSAAPRSTFVAVGSEVAVRTGQRIT